TVRRSARQSSFRVHCCTKPPMSLAAAVMSFWVSSIIPMTGSPRAQTRRTDRERPQPGTRRSAPHGPISQCSIHVLDVDLVAHEVVARGRQARVAPGVLVDKHAGSSAVFYPAVLGQELPGHVNIRRSGMIAPTIGYRDVAK